MKKSQLRKIIKESIKELMTEQSQGEFQYTAGSLPSGDCKSIRVNKCDENLSNYGGGPIPMSVCAYIDGNVPQIGDTFLVPAAYLNHYSGIYSAVAGHVVAVTHVSSPPSWHGGTSYTNITSAPCTPTPPPPSCDTTPASACATQWFQNPNANWAANWINNRSCTNYTWPANNLPVQAMAIMATAPTPAPNVFNDYNDIWNAGNSSGLTGQQKNQFIGKMAKGQYSLCQKQACNC